MATLMHLKLLFQIAQLPEMASIGLDFESNFTVITAHMNDVLTRASDQWKVKMEPRFPASSNLKKLFVYSYAIAGGKRVIEEGPIEINHTAAGSGGGTALPPQNSIVVTHRTNLSSRRTRGRVYLPPSGTTQVAENGTIQSAYRAQLQTSYNQWVEEIQNAASVPQTFTHVVASLTGGTVRKVTAREVNSRVDTQRRRLPK
jgi:hypothetical protein